jgi:hypothetical protein
MTMLVVLMLVSAGAQDTPAIFSPPWHGVNTYA